MQIDMRELKAVTNRLLDHIIETRGVDVVDIDQPNYWHIPSEAVYSAHSPPSELDVGSLADDWELLRSLLGSDIDPVVYQLTELAPLLRYIGEVLGRELAKEGG
jgi:hypothetical protein